LKINEAPDFPQSSSYLPVKMPDVLAPKAEKIKQKANHKVEHLLMNSPIRARIHGLFNLNAVILSMLTTY
jgi:hypothetical protein